MFLYIPVQKNNQTNGSYVYGLRLKSVSVTAETLDKWHFVETNQMIHDITGGINDNPPHVKHTKNSWVISSTYFLG